MVSNFILQALQNKDVTVYGDGSQTRSFQYVDDLVDGLIGLMNSGIIRTQVYFQTNFQKSRHPLTSATRTSIRLASLPNSSFDSPRPTHALSTCQRLR